MSVIAEGITYMCSGSYSVCKTIKSYVREAESSQVSKHLLSVLTLGMQTQAEDDLLPSKSFPQRMGELKRRTEGDLQVGVWKRKSRASGKQPQEKR